MKLDELFTKLNKARQAISAALDIANFESEVQEAINALEEKGDTKPGSLEDRQLDALYSIQDALVSIDSELDSWEAELVNCKAIPAPTE